jgi:hypothetical protein
MTIKLRLRSVFYLIILISSPAVHGFSNLAGEAFRSLSRASKQDPSSLYQQLQPEEPTPSSESTGNSIAPSAYGEGDPRQALEQFGSLFSQMQVIVTEGNTWDSDKLEEKTREFVTTYVKVFVPGMGYVATSLAVYISSFAAVSIPLAVSGHGYEDLLALTSAYEPLRNFLAEKLDPTWGNLAITLVILEILSPAILAATLALSPKTTDVLRSNLDGWGWGEEGIDVRVSEILGK